MRRQLSFGDLGKRRRWRLGKRGRLGFAGRVSVLSPAPILCRECCPLVATAALSSQGGKRCFGSSARVRGRDVREVYCGHRSAAVAAGKTTNAGKCAVAVQGSADER